MIKIFHGDNYDTKKINVALMNNGNNQEWVGIYFSNELKDAENYGQDVISVLIDEDNFINSRACIATIWKEKIKKIFNSLLVLDQNAFYYFITDYGVEIHEPKNISKKHIEDLAQLIEGEEVRNFQIDLANRFGVDQFVNIWNKTTKIDGTKQKQPNGATWYSVINPKIKLN